MSTSYCRLPWKRLLVWLIAVCFTCTIMVPVAMAKEPAQPELSLNQAIALALSNSDSVKKATKDIDRTEEWRTYRADKINYIPISPPGTAAVEVPWGQFLAADLTWRMSKKSLTAQEDSVALDACKKYWDVLKGQEAVKAAQTSLDNARQQKIKARAMYEVGMASQSALIAAEVQYKGAEATLAGARNDLDKAYTAFNQLVGLWPEDRPVLTNTVEFQSLSVDSLDYEVAKVMESCPTVWLTQETVTMKKYLEDMMFYTGEYRPYQARKIEVEQAELDAASTRKLFELATRNLYYGVKSLEEQYAGALERERLAEENLRVVRVKFDVGMATAAEVAAAEKDLANAQSGQYGVYDLACQHAYYKLAFQKPWAYLGSMSSGGSAGGGQTGMGQ